MKKQISTLVLALGLTASPVFAKQATNKRANSKDKSNIQQDGKHIRSENSLKRILHLEAEKDLIKEIEEEINELVNKNLIPVKDEKNLSYTSDEYEVVYKENIPANNIEIKLS